MSSSSSGSGAFAAGAAAAADGAAAAAADGAAAALPAYLPRKEMRGWEWRPSSVRREAHTNNKNKEKKNSSQKYEALKLTSPDSR